MRNRPLPGYHRHGPSDQQAEESRAGFNARLFVLFAVIVVAFATIAARLAWIQTRLADVYTASFNFTRTEYEVIPGRDGRILTDDTVLAADVVRYDVEVHYRWLEQPADDNWVTRRARLAVPRSARRDTRRMALAKADVIAERNEMWSRLASITGVPLSTFAERRIAIQERVERIAESVNRRQREHTGPAEEPAAGWMQQIRQQLSSAPKRRSLAPIIVQEELDYHPLAQDVSLGVAAEIRAHPELFPGLRIQETTARTYPQGSLAAHVVGTRSRAADEGQPHRSGRSGIERSWDGRLRGIDGRRKVTYNRRGEVISTEVVRKPVSGRDVVLTLDTHLQRSAEQLLDRALAGNTQKTPAADSSATEDSPPPVPTGGCIVVLDANSGEVVAMAAAPRFDLNLLTNPDERWQQTLDDPRHPLFPRAVQMTVPPGSVFKVLTAVALLEGTELDPRTTHACRGYLDRPDRHRCSIYRNYGVGHGPVDLRMALAQSCNVYFFSAARQMGAEPLVHWSRRFGFGQPTGIDLPFERRGNLPAPEAQSGANAPRWYSGDTLGLAIGQSRLTTTPVQIARMMAVIANGGFLVTPRVAAESGSIGTPPAADSWSPRPRRRIHGLSPESLDEIQHGLFSAVQDPGGTAYRTVRLDSVSIAGKTGTAEVGGNREDHAWFAGYVPAGRPQFAFVVMLEHGGSGGRSAGPVARNLVQAMVESGLLPTANVAKR